MGKKKKELVVQSEKQFDENYIFECVSQIIENRKSRAGAYANAEVTIMFWEVGRYINSVILDFKRAVYGKKIFAALSQKLIVRFGNSFSERNLYRMTQFYINFSFILLNKT